MREDWDVTLSPRQVEALNRYWESHPKGEWVFEGQRPATPYSERSIQLVVKEAALRAGITRNVTPHMLRHSGVYPDCQQKSHRRIGSPHLLESGTDIRYIQDALGHTSIKACPAVSRASGSKVEGPRSVPPSFGWTHHKRGRESEAGIAVG